MQNYIKTVKIFVPASILFLNIHIVMVTLYTVHDYVSDQPLHLTEHYTYVTRLHVIHILVNEH